LIRGGGDGVLEWEGKELTRREVRKNRRSKIGGGNISPWLVDRSCLEEIKKGMPQGGEVLDEGEERKGFLPL